MHGKDAIPASGAKGYQLAAEGLADAPSPIFEIDEAVAADFADLVARRVFDCWQNVGDGLRARPVSLRRRRHAERFVRPLMIIARTPFVEGTLALAEITKAAPVHHFGLEGAVEALF